MNKQLPYFKKTPSFKQALMSLGLIFIATGEFGR